MCIFGYCRISTSKQSIDRQIRNIIAEYPTAKIIQEVFTGTTTERKELNKLLKRVQKGDTIVFDSVSRMSRNASEGFILYKDLYEKGINLVFLKERHIDTQSYAEALQGIITTESNTGDTATDDLINGIMQAINKFMFNKVEQDIFKAFEQSEKEVTDLRQRTKEGIQTARLNGKQIGAVKGSKLNVKKKEPAKQKILKYSKTFNGNLGDEDCIKIAGISRATYYKYKAELKQELTNL